MINDSNDSNSSESSTSSLVALANRGPQLYLASRSPRRLELLAQLGISPQVIAADTDETVAPGESPAAYVARIASAKAQAGWAGLRTPVRLPLLAADTAVVAGGQILGKPKDAEAALQMLALLSNGWHRVLTAVCLLRPGPGSLPAPGTGAIGADTAPGQRAVLVATEVQMRSITAAEALAYWETGEPKDKAGAYAVQGRGAIFVEQIRGSYSNVVGLPLFETAALLREQGIDPLGR
ncbi:MAG: septum formation protein Maf [Halochromatium sp.]|nr:septum formation protein Maf [Halochromatium sp.]